MALQPEELLIFIVADHIYMERFLIKEKQLVFIAPMKSILRGDHKYQSGHIMSCGARNGCTKIY